MREPRSFRFTLLCLPLAALLLGVIIDFALMNPGPGPADPQGYFAWQQSLLIDHDLDPANQLEGLPQYFPDLTLPWLEQPVRVNKYPIGWSITVLPATATASAILHTTGHGNTPHVKPGHEAAYGYAVWLIVPVLGMAAVLLAYGTLCHYFTADLSALAVTTAFFGSSALMYFCFEPYMSHGVSAFWLALTYWCIARYAHGGRRILIGAAALAGGMVVLTRPMNGLALLPAAMLLLNARGRDRRTLWLDLPPAGLLFLMTISLQGLLYLHLYGRFFFNPYAANGEHFTGSLANLGPFLFDVQRSHGLCVWHPALVLALAGMAIAAARRGRADVRAAGGVALGVIAVVILIYAFWWYWWLGTSWGARWTTDFLPLWAFGLAAWAKGVHARRNPARTAAWYCLPLAGVSLGLMGYQFLDAYIHA